jgi:hypothetical protein
MFEQASRLKVRFPYKGMCTVEDLWDIPLKGLDSIFKAVNAQNKLQSEESLLETKNPANTILDLQIAIVKHVVAVRLQEKKDRENAAENAARKQKVMEIIERKQDQALENLSIEELTKLAQGDTASA